jgi:hypothetical protein
MRKIILLLSVILYHSAHGQVNGIVIKTDTAGIVVKDSPKARKDSAAPKRIIVDTVRRDSLSRIDSFVGIRPIKLRAIESLFMAEPYPTVYGDHVGGFLKNDKRFGPTTPVLRVRQLVRVAPRVEWMFYLFCGILLLLSFLRLAFFKYFLDLFKVFFNTSMRQKQIREQLSQAPLPSLLLNIFFFIIGGIFLYFLFDHYRALPTDSVALMVILCILALAALYLGKYVFVTMLGWTFDKRTASENYLFVVFMVNKMAGLFLLPMTLLMAYTEPGERQVIITLTVIGLVILGIVRLVRGFASISNILKINPLHFIVFVAAFEVIPVLLIYKGLLMFI